MSDSTNGPAPLGTGTDINAADLDVEGNDSVVETSDPDAYDDDGTLAGLGGAEQTGGGAG